MTSLVDKGLAYLDHSTGGDAPQARWQMLDVVRGFVLTHPPDNAGQASRQTYLSFFIELLASTRAKLGREQEWFRVIEAEDANLRAALGWAAEAGDAQSLLRLANGMWLYWQARGALIEGRHWLDLGLRLDPPADAETRMVSLWATAMLAHHQGNDVEARERAEELRELATRHGDNAALRNAITVLGMTAMSGDDPSDAVSEFQRALELAATIDDEWIKATSHLNLGMGLLNAGEISDARLALGEALRRYEQLGDERFHARSVGYLGIASLLDGDPQRARSLFADSLQVFHRLGEPGGTAEALTGLAAAHAAAGDAERAAVLAGAAERLRQSVAARQLPMDKRTNEHHLALAREQLGEQRWAGLWQAGHDGNLNDAVEQALMSEGA
jgi:tetratricopeptide (TPR) repeat protein